MKKALLVATVQSHICQFHKPLIELLKENNYEVHIAARDNLSEKNGLKLENVDKVYNVAFSRSPLNINNIKSYKELKNIINQNKYDIISCNTPVGGIVTRLASIKSRKLGSKVYYMAHGFHFYEGAPKKNWILYYPIEKLMAKITDKLITITEEDYNLAKIKKFNTKVEHVYGVGVDPKRYTPISKSDKNNIRKIEGYSEDEYVCICTGELNKNKNQETVIRAIYNVKQEIPNIKLLLAGNGPMNEPLHSLVKKLDLNDNIRFLGYRTDLEKFVMLSDVVITASKREGLPLNVIEAMLSEKPVIASRNRGHKELVINNKNGYIVTYDDVKAFERCIKELYFNNKLREEMGRNGLILSDKYKKEKIKNKLREIYEIGNYNERL